MQKTAIVITALRTSVIM